MSSAHIQSSGRLRARSPAPDRWGKRLRVEAKEGGGGSSREGGGSRKADLRAEPRGNREPVPAEAEAAGKVAPAAPDFPAPPLKAAPPARGALPNPFLTLGVKLCEATGQSGGTGNA